MSMLITGDNVPKSFVARNLYVQKTDQCEYATYGNILSMVSKCWQPIQVGLDDFQNVVKTK
jgi:hypothetical protein